VDANTITLIPAGDAHFEAILQLERDAGRSLVALTEGHALREAHARGHAIVVAMAGRDVAGWIWYGRSLERGGEEIGQIYRVAVRGESRRTGIGRELIGHAIDELKSHGCTRVRTLVEGGDEVARALFADAAFSVESVTMEREL
jgi:ribosomal protein S18 acetylase RimI-like enzyme